MFSDRNMIKFENLRKAVQAKWLIDVVTREARQIKMQVIDVNVTGGKIYLRCCLPNDRNRVVDVQLGGRLELVFDRSLHFLEVVYGPEKEGEEDRWVNWAQKMVSRKKETILENINKRIEKYGCF